MTDTEYRSHFSLWAMMAAPLIAGNDIVVMSDATRAILLNTEVIAIDQDRLGIQGHRVWKDGDREIWSKSMSDGGRALLLFNRGDVPTSIAADWTMLGLPQRVRMEVRDLWEHKDLGKHSGRFEASVAPHGIVMVRLKQ